MLLSCSCALSLKPGSHSLTKEVVYKRYPTMIVVENFINGKFVPTDSYIDSFDPSTGEVWAKVPASGEREVQLAVEGAEAALTQ